MTTFRAAAMGISIVAAAAVAAGSAVGAVFESTAPHLASEGSLFDGFARSRLASLTIAQSATKDPTDKLKLGTEARRNVVELSREAYSSEPLNSVALRNLAMVADDEGRSEEAFALMSHSLTLSKRDLATNSWFIQHYAAQHDEANSLRSFDRAMRTSNRGRAIFIDGLLASAEQDGVAEPLMKLLSEEQPIWEQQFWLEAYRFPRSAPNLARIRIHRALYGYEGDDRIDQALLDSLLRESEFEVALQLHNALNPASRVRGSRNRNPEFSSPPRFRPFDWDLQFENSILPDLDDTAGVLRVDTAAGAQGLVARQLVKLDDQVNRLVVVTTDWNAPSSHGFSLRFACAERGRGSEGSRALPINAARLKVDFRKPDKDCVFYWLNLYVAKDTSMPDGTLTFDEVSITSLG